MSKREIAVAAGTGVAAGVGAVIGYQAWKRATERDMVDGRPAELRRLDPTKISADPETFQFKSGGDQKGVTDRLKSVGKWNPVAAGKAMVFERMDGSHVIADGHQRLGLAQRLSSEGQKGIKLDAYVLRERDGWTARDVRAYAAIKNMHESSGEALDMAKVMRERPDLVTKSMPISDSKVKDAKALAKLSDAAFRMVAGGVVKPEHAAAVGEAVGDSQRHEGMIKEMAKAEIGSAQHARLFVGQAMAAATHTETTHSLFGEEINTRSLLKERAQVLDKALQALKSDKRIFGLLEREAGNIEAVGNKLSHSANVEKAEGAGRTAALIEKLATTRGPVSEMIDAAARAVAEGKKPAAAAREFVKTVGATLKKGGINALTGSEPVRMQMMVEDGPKKGQGSMFGEATMADKIAAANRAIDAKGRTGDPMNEGLFGSGKLQADLVDMAKQAPASRTPTVEDVKQQIRDHFAGTADGKVRRTDGSLINDNPYAVDPAVSRNIDRLERLGHDKFREAAKALNMDASGGNSEIRARIEKASAMDWTGKLEAVANKFETNARAAAEAELKALVAKTGAPAGAQAKAVAAGMAEHDRVDKESMKGRPGWSDEARAASAEVRGEKAMAKGDKAAILSNAQQNFKAKYGGDFDMMQHATAADLRKMIDSRMTQQQAFAELDRIKTAGERRLANAETPVPTANRSEADKLRAERENRLRNRAGAGGIEGAAADRFVRENLAKLEALDAKRAGAAPSAPAVSAEEQARLQKAADVFKDVRAPTGKLSRAENAELKKSQKARLASARAQIAAMSDVPTISPAEPHKGTPIPPRKDPYGSGMNDLGSVAEQIRAEKAANTPRARAAADFEKITGRKPPSRMTIAAMRGHIENIQALPKHPGSTLGEPASSGLRGTQNAANQAAIIKNRKANALPFKNPPKYSSPEALDERNRKAKVARTKGAIAGLKANADGRTNVELVRNLEATAMGAKRIRPDGEVAPGKAAPAPKSGAGKKALGLLAPVAIGAAALVAANQSAKAGESKVQQLKAGSTEAVKGTGTLAAFAAGTAVVAKGFMKAGLTAAKAAPATQAVLMVGGAVHGAVTAAPGERMKGAAKGAWDMSLPGMIANTAVAVKEAVKSTADRAPVNGRLSDQQAKAYAGASARFATMQHAARETDGPAKAKGWSNAARIGAYQARAAKAGFDPTNMPYGGKPENGPDKWRGTKP